MDTSFLIKIGVDKASWEKLSQKFKNLFDLQKKVKKEFNELKAAQAQSFGKTKPIDETIRKMDKLEKEIKKVTSAQKTLATRLKKDFAGLGKINIGRPVSQIKKEFKDIQKVATGVTKTVNQRMLDMWKIPVAPKLKKDFADLGKINIGRPANQIKKEFKDVQKVATGVTKTVNQRMRDMWKIPESPAIKLKKDFTDLGKISIGKPANQVRKEFKGIQKVSTGVTKNVNRQLLDMWKIPQTVGKDISKKFDNIAAAQAQAAKQMLSGNQARQETIKLEKKNIDQKTKLGNFTERISKLEKRREHFRSQAAKVANSDIKAHNRFFEKQLKIENEINNLKSKQSLRTSKAATAKRVAERQFSSKELLAATQQTHKLRLAMSRMYDTADSDRLKNRINELRNSMRGINQDFTTVNSRKEFDALNAKVKKTQKEFNNLGKRHKKVTKDMNRRQSLINSKFGSFTIIMTAMAATLFVWQELIQAIRGVASVIDDAEQAMAKLQVGIGGTNEQIEAMYAAAERADISGLMSLPDAVTQLEQLRKAGYDTSEAIAILDVRLANLDKIASKTTAGSLKKLVGLLKEITRDIFMGTSFKKDLDAFNKFLETQQKFKDFKIEYDIEVPEEETFFEKLTQKNGTKNDKTC